MSDLPSLEDLIIHRIYTWENVHKHISLIMHELVDLNVEIEIVNNLTEAVRTPIWDCVGLTILDSVQESLE